MTIASDPRRPAIEDLADVTALWMVTWYRHGQSCAIDFDEREEGYRFARDLEEAGGREKVMVVRHDVDIDQEDMAAAIARGRERALAYAEETKRLAEWRATGMFS